MAWTSPSLQLRWGPYFRSDVADQKTVVDMARAALSGEGGALITKRHAVQKLASIFDIENIDAVLDEIEKEDGERQRKAIEQARAEVSGLHGMTDDSDGEAGRGEPKSPGKGGSGRSAASAAKAEADD